MTGVPAERVSTDERRALRAWQRRIVASFVAAMILLGVLLVLGLAFRVPDRYLVAPGLVLLGLTVYGVRLQLAAQCPRCHARIGRYSRLALPQRCPRCHVELRPPTAFERRTGAAPWTEDGPR
jgi:hypothetical protein